jgi:hypothetical protein
LLDEAAMRRTVELCDPLDPVIRLAENGIRLP